MARQFYTIAPTDIGRWIIRPFGRPEMVVNFMGRILPGDVGKRIYQVGDILQVENDEQRDARLSAPVKAGDSPTMAIINHRRSVQAIVTRYLGPTDRQGSRVKATAQAGSITVGWDDALNSDGNHDAAALALAARFGWEGDLARGGVPEGNANVYVFTT